MLTHELSFTVALQLKVQNLTKEYNVPFWESAPFSWWRYIPRYAATHCVATE